MMSPKQAFELLEFDHSYVGKSIQAAFDIGGQAEVEVELRRFKKEVTKRYRRMAKELHPDVRGEHEKMVALNQAKDYLHTVKVEIKQPQSEHMRVFRYSYTDATSSTSDGATMSW